MNLKVKEVDCKCCAARRFWKRHKSDVVEYKLFCELSQYGWRKGERKIKGKQISTITTKLYDLKYCPVCGRKV